MFQNEFIAWQPVFETQSAQIMNCLYHNVLSVSTIWVLSGGHGFYTYYLPVMSLVTQVQAVARHLVCAPR